MSALLCVPSVSLEGCCVVCSFPWLLLRARETQQVLLGQSRYEVPQAAIKANSFDLTGQEMDPVVTIKNRNRIFTTLPEANKSVPQFANPVGFEGFAINGGGGDFPSSAPNGDGKG